MEGLWGSTVTIDMRVFIYFLSFCTFILIKDNLVNLFKYLILYLNGYRFRYKSGINAVDKAKQSRFRREDGRVIRVKVVRNIGALELFRWVKKGKVKKVYYNTLTIKDSKRVLEEMQRPISVKSRENGKKLVEYFKILEQDKDISKREMVKERAARFRENLTIEE
jgi:hypothetical protein